MQQPPQGYGAPPPGYGPPGYPPPQQPPPSKWYHGAFFIALSILFCFPMGLALLWTAPRASKGAKIGGTVAVGVLVLIALGSNKGDRTSTSGTGATFAAAGPQAGNAPATEAPLVYVTEPCLKLATTFGTDSKLSDLQKEELWKQYEGKAFQWDLEITEVSSGVLSGFQVQAKCAPESPSLIQDVQISYDGDAKPLVMQLQKGKVYKLKGKLTHSSSLLGMGADGIL
jgi:hypothetical protein